MSRWCITTQHSATTRAARRRRPLLLLLLSLMLLALPCACVRASPVDVHVMHDDDMASVHYIIELTDDNFDANVFPDRAATPSTRATASSSTQVPWLIFFYAPWCAYCKQLMPIFEAANRLAHYQTPGLRTRFGRVNAQDNAALRRRFHLERYPTVIYTLGVGQHWSVFSGARHTPRLASFAEALDRALDTGGFVHDFTHPRALAHHLGEDVCANATATAHDDKDDKDESSSEGSDDTHAAETARGRSDGDDGDGAYRHRHQRDGRTHTRRAQTAAAMAAHDAAEPLLLVWVPANSTSTRATQVRAAWRVLLDSTITYVHSREGVIYEAELSRDDTHDDEDMRTGSGGSGSDSSRRACARADARVRALHARIVATARRCAARPRQHRGPGGEVLLSVNSRFRQPYCYDGPWQLADDDNIDNNASDNNTRTNATALVTAAHDSDALPLRVHPRLEAFLVANCYGAVNAFVVNLLLPLHRGRGIRYVAILIVQDEIDKKRDVDYLPAVREMARTYNDDWLERQRAQRRAKSTKQQQRRHAHATQLSSTPRSDQSSSRNNNNDNNDDDDDDVIDDMPDVTWAYMRAQNDEERLQLWGVHVDELPTVVLLDVVRSRLFRTRVHAPLFERTKRQLPWRVDGAPYTALLSFVQQATRGALAAEKTTRLGYVAEYLSYLPLLDRVYVTFDYDDAYFVAAVAVAAVVVVVSAALLLRATATMLRARRARHTLAKKQQ